MVQTSSVETGPSAQQDCTSCGINPCYTEGKPNERLTGCPMNSKTEILDEAAKIYDEPSMRKLARASAKVEAGGNLKWTRIEDTIEFSHAMGYKKLGIACCIGLKREAAILESILKENGFSVVSAICKTGGVEKEKLGVEENERIHPGMFEAMCNPIAQAMLLDNAGSEFNIVFGLCVGHDSLFYKTSKAPVTTLVAKDRVLGHNPIVAIYNHQTYYNRKLRRDHLKKSQ